MLCSLDIDGFGQLLLGRFTVSFQARRDHWVLVSLQRFDLLFGELLALDAVRPGSTTLRQAADLRIQAAGPLVRSRKRRTTT